MCMHPLMHTNPSPPHYLLLYSTFHIATHLHLLFFLILLLISRSNLPTHTHPKEPPIHRTLKKMLII